MEAKITIIVPVYNGEKFLKPCLESIRAQTFSDYEVILVNDGSSDNSQQILEDYSKKDERFFTYNLPNGGVSKARNFGLSKAQGEWITFVDCDDWLEINYLEVLYSQVDENVDIVMASFFFNKENIGESITKCSLPIIHKSDFSAYPFAMMVEDCAELNNLSISVEILCAACNKLTRRQLIISNNIKFEERLQLNEDGLFHLSCYLKANDIIIIDKPLYHYRILRTSSNYRFRPNVDEQMGVWKECFEQAVSSFSKQDKEIFSSLSAYRRYLNLMSLNVNNPDNKIGFVKKYNNLCSFIKNGGYEVYIIPNSLKWFKRLEMYFLKHKCYLALFILSNIRLKLKRKCGII